MKNIFELFGFLSMALISGVIIFIVMGKKDSLNALRTNDLVSEYNTISESPNAPRPVTKNSRDSYASDSGSARRASAKGASTTKALSQEAAADRVKQLYSDKRFVTTMANNWKDIVSDIADEYNVKPQLLLANTVLQSYIGDYSKSDLRADAAQHAGDRVMPLSNAAKKYAFGWSVQKITNDYNLNQYFAQEIPVATASAVPSIVASKNSSSSVSKSKASTKTVTQTAKVSPVESGLQQMVAKEYGFNSWNGLMKLGAADVKSKAQSKVQSLMMAARIK